MPVYEYKCEQCDKVFDKLIRNIYKTVEITCPDCQSRDVSKLISSFAFSGSSPQTSNGMSGNSCTSCTSTDCSTCK